MRFLWAWSLVLGLTIAPTVLGCSCVTVSLKERFFGASDVFLGKVVSVDGPSLTIDVSRTFYGAVGRGLVSVQSDLCGPLLEAGETYLLFAQRHNEQLRNLACAATDVSTTAGREDVSQLQRRVLWWRFTRAFQRRDG